VRSDAPSACTLEGQRFANSTCPIRTDRFSRVSIHVDVAMECDAWREALQAFTKIRDLLLSEADLVSEDSEFIVDRLAGIAADSWRKGARGARPYSDAVIGLLRQLDTPHSKNLIESLDGLPSTARDSAGLSPRGQLTCLSQ
jgi:hypothetical protein